MHISLANRPLSTLAPAHCCRVTTGVVYLSVFVVLIADCRCFTAESRLLPLNAVIPPLLRSRLPSAALPCVQNKVPGFEKNRLDMPDARGLTQGTLLKVPGMTLDALVEASHLQKAKCYLLKIDAEGHDFAVLRGGQNLLQDPKRRPKFIGLELVLTGTYRGHPETLQDVVRMWQCTRHASNRCPLHSGVLYPPPPRPPPHGSPTARQEHGEAPEKSGEGVVPEETGQAGPRSPLAVLSATDEEWENRERIRVVVISPCQGNPADTHTPVRTGPYWSRQTRHGLGVSIWMHLVNGAGSSPSLGQPTPGWLNRVSHPGAPLTQPGRVQTHRGSDCSVARGQ